MTIRAFLHSRTGAVLAGATVLATLGSVGSAVAAGTIGSSDIRNGAVHSVDIANGDVQQIDLDKGSVGYAQLTATVKQALKSGGLKDLESDGPYPGATKLQQGDNSTATWVGDGGATLQVSWVQCAPGKTAIGGGFSRADEGTAAFRNLQIVTSRPAQYQGGDEIYQAIKGDPDGSFVPNAWVVEGFNNSDNGEVIVRPWVVCAAIK